MTERFILDDSIISQRPWDGPKEEEPPRKLTPEEIDALLRGETDTVVQPPKDKE